MSDLHAVFAYIDDHVGRAISLLDRISRQPSISAQGVGLEEMADLAMQVLEEYGCRARLLPGHGGPPAVYGADGQTGGPTVLLYSHYDVQPAEPLDLWESPPFEPTIRDGNLYARGVSDNKGDIAARLEALAALRDVTGGLPVNVKFFFEGEEESGGPHLKSILEENADLLAADVVFLEGMGITRGGRPSMSLGAKGMLYVELEAKSSRVDAHSGMAAVVPSAAWRLLWALASLKGPDGKVLVPGFYDAVRPWKESELVALRGMPPQDDETKEQLGLESFIDNLDGYPWLERLLGSPTCNICGFHSGYGGPGSKTVLPAVAKAKLDFRLVPDQEPPDILEKLRRHLDQQGFDDIIVNALSDAYYPARTDVEDPYVKVVAQVAQDFYQAETIVAPGMHASIGMSAFADTLGVPVLLPPGGVDYWASNHHAPNEHVRIEDFVSCIKFMATLLTRMGEMT